VAPRSRFRHDRDVEIAKLAARQHGVVARAQLHERGLRRGAILHRLESGRLHLVHRGVYAVGHPRLTLRGRWMAAALAARGVLSHRDAAALWGVRADHRTAIELSASHPVARPGLHVHQTRLAPDEVTVVDAIPVTTIARTLLDLAAVVSARQVERALAEAEHARLHDRLSVADLLDRHPGRPGAATLRGLLRDATFASTRTRSGLEEDFLALLRRHGLPRPALNVHLPDAAGRLHECDAVWRAARVVVELDDPRYHAGHRAFAHDRAKSRALTVAGWQVVRVASAHLADPAPLLADLSCLLARVR
jgi:predicted transcriptional regulator of viral defense system